MSQTPPLVAYHLAVVLRNWHHTVGRNLAREKLEGFEAGYYAGALSDLAWLDPHDQRQIRRLAYEQLDGAFTPFSAQGVPPRLWEPVARQFDISTPETLGDLARQILSLLEPGAPDPAAGPAFALPDGWPHEAVTIEPRAESVKVGPDETPRAALEAYFGRLDQYLERGLGGRELMVCMNEDEVRWRGEGGERGARYERQITVLNPACFGFQLVNKEDGEDHIVLRCLAGEVEILGVTLDTE